MKVALWCYEIDEFLVFCIVCLHWEGIKVDVVDFQKWGVWGLAELPCINSSNGMVEFGL